MGSENSFQNFKLKRKERLVVIISLWWVESLIMVSTGEEYRSSWCWKTWELLVEKVSKVFGESL